MFAVGISNKTSFYFTYLQVKLQYKKSIKISLSYLLNSAGECPLTALQKLVRGRQHYIKTSNPNQPLGWLAHYFVHFFSVIIHSVVVLGVAASPTYTPVYFCIAFIKPDVFSSFIHFYVSSGSSVEHFLSRNPLPFTSKSQEDQVYTKELTTFNGNKLTAQITSSFRKFLGFQVTTCIIQTVSAVLKIMHFIARS